MEIHDVRTGGPDGVDCRHLGGKLRDLLRRERGQLLRRERGKLFRGERRQRLLPLLLELFLFLLFGFASEDQDQDQQKQEQGQTADGRIKHPVRQTEHPYVGRGLRLTAGIHSRLGVERVNDDGDLIRLVIRADAGGPRDQRIEPCGVDGAVGDIAVDGDCHREVGYRAHRLGLDFGIAYVVIDLAGGVDLRLRAGEVALSHDVFIQIGVGRGAHDAAGGGAVSTDEVVAPDTGTDDALAECGAVLGPLRLVINQVLAVCTAHIHRTADADTEILQPEHGYLLSTWASSASFSSAELASVIVSPPAVS